MPDSAPAQFFGKLHLLLVHLPIGILLFAAASTLFSSKPKPENALSALWFWGMASAIFACLTGWFLANAGGQNAAQLPVHQWLALTTAALATSFWFFREKIFRGRNLTRAWAAVTLFYLLATTHFGAVLTHGENYFQPRTERQNRHSEKNLTPAADVPATPEKPAQALDLQALANASVSVLPVAAGSNFLSVNCLNAPGFNDSTARLLEKIAPQTVWLKLSGTAISDSALTSVSKLENLSRLHLDHSKITDGGMLLLKNLNNLQTLSLVGTGVSAAGLAAVSANFPKLKKVFLYKTNVKTADWPALRAAFPNVEIDTGAYFVPTFASDTTKISF